MRTKLELFFKWGIVFESEYAVPEQAARNVQYADRFELETNILRQTCDFNEDFNEDEMEPSEPPEETRRGGSLHAPAQEYRTEQQTEFRKPPLRTD